MAKKSKLEVQQKENESLLNECIAHQEESARNLQKISGTWDEKEAMLIGNTDDSLSKKTKNKIFDPRLSTIVFERASRVMAQEPKGKAYAVSEDDIGKSALMNLYLDHARKNDNEQFSHLIKLRMLDLYSLVYGSMFALVPWRVNMDQSVAAPATYVIPIRDAFPQAGIRNINEMNYFTVRTWLSVDFLRNVDENIWNKAEVMKLIEQLKREKSQGDKPKSDGNDRSLVERTYYPGMSANSVEVFTEYRRDKWLTWTPQRINSDTSRPFMLRVLNDPYVENMLPVVAKHCFPLIDSPIALGEFERGKTLQYAINSLINLYFQGVKYSIFPPLAINLDGVTPQSIKWGAGEKWFMNRPNQDVQPVNISPRGIETFNSTYGFLLSALNNQSGVTSIPTGSTDSMGKTPQAVRFQANRESARDNWDKLMMEDTVREIYKRWIALTVKKLEKKTAIRLFKDEIDQIKKTNPDVVKVYESGRGTVGLNKSNFADTSFDYELDTGSTMEPNLDSDIETVSEMLKLALEGDKLQSILAQEGKKLDVAELFKRWATLKGVKDTDKLIVPIDQKDMSGQSGAVDDEQKRAILEKIKALKGSPEAKVENKPNPEMPQPPQVNPEEEPGAVPKLKDPDIAALLERVRGGMNGIPQSK